MRASAKAWAGKRCLAVKRGSVLRMGRMFPVLPVMATTAFFFPPAVSAQATEQIGQAARETVRELNLQTDLPFKEDTGGGMWNLPAFEFSSDLFWIALVLMVAFLLYQFRDELPSFGFKRSGNWRENNPGAGDGSGEDGGDDPSMTGDELARQGRYIEAMHWLLLRSLTEIRERLGVRFPDSMTSREILKRARLPANGNRLLKDIITHVELSYFGTYPANEEDYEACRTSFERLMIELQTQPQMSVSAS